jgi:hypothetical protein
VDALATANYLQWYIAQNARMATVKAAKQGKVSQACAFKRAKTVVEGEDGLQNVCSNFTADLNGFGSLRSETLVYDDQPSDPEDKVTQELATISSRPKARPLRDLLYVPYRTPSSLLMPSCLQHGHLQSGTYDTIPGASPDS